MRKPEEFEKAASDRKITKWLTGSCSLCGYRTGYYFNHDLGLVVFDHGCYCVSPNHISQKDWSNVAQQYNIQQHPDVIKKYDEFWGFKPVKK